MAKGAAAASSFSELLYRVLFANPSLSWDMFARAPVNELQKRELELLARSGRTPQTAGPQVSGDLRAKPSPILCTFLATLRWKLCRFAGKLVRHAGGLGAADQSGGREVAAARGSAPAML
jgi:hypothetical protein